MNVREGCCTCYLKLGWGAKWKRVVVRKLRLVRRWG